jgi:hypothetical protein
MLQRRLYHLEIFREGEHGLSGIPFGKSCEEVRVSDTEMTFDPIIHPGQAKNLNRPRAIGAIRVTVKPPVEKHISRLDSHSTRKTGFNERAG